MDWYSWLSKTGLEPSLVYDYSLIFRQNELQAEDITYFNHEFLHSMGISVAKHRLEIIKLAKKEAGRIPIALSRLVIAIGKTKRLLTKNFSKLAFQKDSTQMALSELTPCRTHWTGALRKHGNSKEHKQEKVTVTTRSTMRSGPLDRRSQERVIVRNRALSLSGPLDGKARERLMFTNWSHMATMTPDERSKERWVVANRSPTVSSPLDGRVLSPVFGTTTNYNKERIRRDQEIQSLWTLMFQNMKPT